MLQELLYPGPSRGGAEVLYRAWGGNTIQPTMGHLYITGCPTHTHFHIGWLFRVANPRLGRHVFERLERTQSKPTLLQHYHADKTCKIKFFIGIIKGLDKHSTLT